MKELLLIRHGEASPFLVQGKDHTRPLTDRGRMEVGNQARSFSADEPFDLVLSSDAVRTLETSREFMDILELPDNKLIIEPAIYAAESLGLLRILTGIPEKARRVALVGHNPGISLLLNGLSGEANLHCPTAAFALLAVDADSWSEISYGCAKILSFTQPL
jgi:phosphohistidine phosphatase